MFSHEALGNVLLNKDKLKYSHIGLQYHLGDLDNNLKNTYSYTSTLFCNHYQYKLERDSILVSTI